MLNFHPDHLQDLRDSGLTDETIKESGIYSVPPGDINKKLGKNDNRITSLMAIPYPGCDRYERYKVFPDKDCPNLPRYLQRFASQNHLYNPSNGEFSDRKKPVHIVEGEKNV